MNIRAIILNYGTPELTVSCLRALAAERGGENCLQAVVVDNGSPDDSAAQIQAAITAHGWGDWARLTALAENTGFARGNNLALRAALAEPAPPDFFWLLNSDARALTGALAPLVACMQNHPRAGIAGSRVQDPDGTVQRSAFRFPSIAAEFESGMRLGAVTRLLARRVAAPPPPALETRTDWVPGASMLLRRATLERVGLFDEAFFMYFEDVDFCRRAAQAGWECWYVPASRVVHLMGQSSGVTSALRPRARRPAYWFTARRDYFRKHHGRAGRVLADAAQLAGLGIWRVRQQVQHKPDSDPPQLWRDYFGHSFLP